MDRRDFPSTRPVTLAVLIPLILLVGPRPAGAESADRADEVRAAVSAFSRAFVEADVSALQSLLATTYIHVNGRSGGVLNRDEWLQWVASRHGELSRGELVIDAYRVEDVRVEVHGAAAVVTAVAHASGRRRGEPFTSSVRFTNYWVLQAGQWRRAGFHDSPLPGPGG